MSKIHIPLKKAGNFSLPSLGLGTWEMGGRYERDPNNNDEKDIKVIRSAVDMGITLIDTAEVYAGGHTETIIGMALESLDRNSLHITSKVLPEHLGYDNLIESCKKSLGRLRTDYLDLYLIHAPNSGIPIEQTMKAMNFLFDNEVIRAIGVSNFSSMKLQEAQAYTDYKIVNNQINYSLSAREHEETGTIDYCVKNDILVTAYRPLKHSYETPDQIMLNPLLKKIADEYGKTPAQVALNWLISKKNVVTLFKTSQQRHIEENLGAIGWQLSAQHTEALDLTFPRGETIWGPQI